MLNPRNRLSSSSSSSSSSPSLTASNPFTKTQWHELEQQALIFKYMISGVQIPPHLISTLSLTFGGCGYYQVGYGRKVDAEPGRCRRTDGKKWRCAKEAYMESKYCEKHMHRGKNRLKKAAEAAAAAAATSTITSANNSYSSLPYHHSVSSPSVSSGSSFRPSGSVLSSQPNSSNQHMFLDSGSYNSHGDHKDHYRYMNGMQESYGSESLGTLQSLPESYNPGYSQQQQHCTAMGSDYHRNNEGQKQTMHHFMSENLRNKTSDNSWLDLGDGSTSTQSISTTQLSISPPISSSDHHHQPHLYQPNFTLHQW